MNKDFFLRNTYRNVKELFGDCVRVTITVNSEGINIETEDMTELTDYSMQKINGKWCKNNINV